ncbi:MULTISPECIES: copper homeostasis periplasmic binding protein CopC [Dickeya]|nr:MULTISPECIES: copper homeostasis periplasmic binding protein CopC [Dickeya]
MRVLKTLGLVACMAFSQSVLAHAHLKSQTPAADATVAASLSALSLTFTENIEPAFSGVTLTLNGQTISTGNAVLDNGHKNTLLISLDKTLVSGSYQVNWHVLSVDGHKTTGSYRFNVK